MLGDVSKMSGDESNKGSKDARPANRRDSNESSSDNPCKVRMWVPSRPGVDIILVMNDHYHCIQLKRFHRGERLVRDRQTEEESDSVGSGAPARWIPWPQKRARGFKYDPTPFACAPTTSSLLDQFTVLHLMTRYTDFARKRTYVQAGLNYRDKGSGEEDEPGVRAQEYSSVQGIQQHAKEGESPEPSKKKRKKELSERKKGNSEEVAPTTDYEGSHSEHPENSAEPTDGDKDPATDANRSVGDDGKRKRSRGAIRAERRRIRGAWWWAYYQSACSLNVCPSALDAQARKEASERRRVKRKDQRTTDTICFACREKGHAARDCTKALRPTEEGDGTKRTKKSVGKSAVGICYR